MATTTYLTQKQCIFCQSIYDVTTIVDDGTDWMGHARHSSQTRVFEDCPYCHQNVLVAAEIIKAKQRDVELALQKFNTQLKGKYICSVLYPDSSKVYHYLSDKKYQEGLYGFKKNNGSCIIYVTLCEKVTEVLCLEEMNAVSLFKPIDATYIDLPLLLAKTHSMLNDAVDRKDYHHSGFLADSCRLISNTIDAPIRENFIHLLSHIQGDY